MFFLHCFESLDQCPAFLLNKLYLVQAFLRTLGDLLLLSKTLSLPVRFAGTGRGQIDLQRAPACFLRSSLIRWPSSRYFQRVAARCRLRRCWSWDGCSFFLCKNCSCLFLSRFLVLGDLFFTLIPRVPSDCRCFLAFWASREKEKDDPILTVKQKSILLASSCLAISRQSFQRDKSSAEAKWSIVAIISTEVLSLTTE